MKSKNATGEPEKFAAGKKVFLLYPPSVVQDALLDTLIMNGFEAYTLRDYKKAFRVMEKFPDSIVFINIDDGMPENEWEVYVKGIQKNARTKDIRVGIVSYNQDRALMEKYLMDIAVPCGYVHLKLSLKESTEIIINALNANEARGRRQHIRTYCEEGVRAMLNYNGQFGQYQGKILDISAAGIAVKMPGFPDLPTNTRLEGVQIKLHSTMITADLIIVGKRRDDKAVFIMLFDPHKMDEATNLSIHHFIKENLQHFIDQMAQ